MFANGDQSSQFHSGLQEDDDASFDEFDFESSVPQPVSPSSNPLLGPPTGDTAETPETKNRPWNKQQRMAMTFVNSPKSLHDTVPPSSIQNSVPSESPTPPRSTTGDTTTSTTPPKSLDSSTSSGFRSLFRKPTKQEEEDRLKQEEERKQAEYNSMLEEANNSDFSDVERLQIIYVSGIDLYNRPIVVIVGAHIPPVLDHRRLFLYLLRVMDPIVVNDYVLVYVHTNTSMDNHPGFSWLKKCYGLFRRGYKKNLKQLYLIEATFLIKSIFKLFQPFISAKFWKKLVYIDKLQDIYKHMSPQQFKLPKDILQLLPVDVPDSAPTSTPALEAAQVALPPTQLFGMPLDVVMKYPMNANLDIPAIVSDSVELILRTGVSVQGVFRLSGSRGRVSQIIQIYNSGSQVDFNCEELHDVTGVLKQYIRELPDPICCFSLYKEWLTAYNHQDAEATLNNLKILLEKLPTLHYKILAKLMHLLHVIASNAETTNMGASNLAIVWAPNLLKSPSESLQTALMETPLANQIITALINNYATLFQPY